MLVGLVLFVSSADFNGIGYMITKIQQQSTAHKEVRSDQVAACNVEAVTVNLWLHHGKPTKQNSVVASDPHFVSNAAASRLSLKPHLQ